MLSSLLLALAPAPPALPAQEPEQVVDFVLRTAPQSFDPTAAVPVIDAILQGQVLERLTRYDLSTSPPRPVGDLAASWTVSEDGLTWTFTLQEDLRFHDPFDPPLWPGRTRALTAQDVLASWLRQADARGGSGGYWTMEGVFAGIEDFRAATAALDPEAAEAAFATALEEGIEGLRVLGPHRLEVTLQWPDPHFLDRLAMPYYAVYPREAVTTVGRSMVDHPVGSAAFHVADLIPGQLVVLEATPDWRGRLDAEGRRTMPHLTRATFQLVQEGSTAEEMFLRGATARLSLNSRNAADWLDSETGGLRAELADQGYRLHAFDNLDLTMLAFGMDDPAIGHLPGDEEGNRRRLLLRQAIAAAFPYEAWDKLVRGGLPAVPARNFLAPGIPGETALPDLGWNRRDLDRARALLAEAGHPGGEGLEPLEFLLTGTDPFSRAMGELVESSLEEAGIPIEPVPMPFREQVARARAGDAQLFLRAWIPDWPDGALILQNFQGELVGTDVNLGHFRDAEFDRLFALYRAEPEGPARDELAVALCARLSALVPAVPIDHRRSRIVTQPWLGGVEIAVQQVFALSSYRVLPR